ncbi:hypothetical protein C4588_07585 [Candidatus Parcubacteria bacterium]|nr:MAG: hypothetical protein C4588_07585 [Candidatus Parcubacteria bacterium]
MGRHREKLKTENYTLKDFFMENTTDTLYSILDKAVDINPGIIYFPIRHHSPVCSLKIQELIKEFQPENILIEGPYDFNPSIELLTDEETCPPFAIYSFFVDTSNRLGQNGILTSKENEPARFRCWYPFTDYSPELVALREAKKIGAKALFIDLPYCEMLPAKITENLECDTSPEGMNLFNDYLLQQSSFVKLLCKKRGCRDYGDLWDDMFEAGGRNLSPLDFIKTFLTFCYMSRVDYPPGMLEAEGCKEREAFMAGNIRKSLEEGKKTLVVTGGFHTTVLPGLVKENTSHKTLTSYPQSQAASYITRYGFALLDRHRGYASGMPSPAYYQDLWERTEAGDKTPFTSSALNFITKIAGRARDEGHSVSTSESIEAFNLGLNLSRFRGRKEITRTDLLDGITTSFIKGSLSDGGYNKILKIAFSLLRGDATGRVTPKAGHPPIVKDFYEKTRELSLENLTTSRKEVKLDLYRKEGHRKKSRFLHQLKFLKVSYGYLIKGPDFVRGKNLNLVFETWEIIWNPDIESNLIEKSLYGSTVSDAAGAFLSEQMASIENQTGRAASLLLEACRMGLQGHIKNLGDIISSILEKDQDFPSLSSAMGDLCLIYKYRDALEAKGLESLLPLIYACYKQALCLLEEIIKTGKEKQKEIFEAFRKFHSIILSFKDLLPDKEIYVEGLKKALSVKDGCPLIRGAFMGVLYSFGEISEEEMEREFSGYLNGSPEYALLAPDFLEGILASAKYILMELSSVFQVLHRFLLESHEETFLRLLPGLRRASTVFTPRESEIMGKKIAKYLGITQENLSFKSHVPSSVTSKGLEIDKKVTELMKEWRVLR